MLAALPNLPEDKEALKALVAALLQERDESHIETLRLQVELAGLKKRYYGPRADRLETTDELAQLLLNFAEELDRKPVNAEDSQAQNRDILLREFFTITCFHSIG